MIIIIIGMYSSFHCEYQFVRIPKNLNTAGNSTTTTHIRMLTNDPGACGIVVNLNICISSNVRRKTFRTCCLLLVIESTRGNNTIAVYIVLRGYCVTKHLGNSKWNYIFCKRQQKCVQFWRCTCKFIRLKIPQQNNVTASIVQKIIEINCAAHGFPIGNTHSEQKNFTRIFFLLAIRFCSEMCSIILMDHYIGREISRFVAAKFMYL